MNIKIENLSYEAWDEMYYILNKQKKFIKKPTKKPKQLSKIKQNKVKKYLTLLLALIIVIITRCILNIHILITIITGIYLLIIITSKILNNYTVYKYIKNDINKRINTKYKMTSLKINEQGIILVKSRKHIIKLLYQDISNILINKETIIFLSKNPNVYSIVVPIKIKKRVLDKLKKENHTNLIIDNNI